MLIQTLHRGVAYHLWIAIYSITYFERNCFPAKHESEMFTRSDDPLWCRTIYDIALTQQNAATQGGIITARQSWGKVMFS